MPTTIAHKATIESGDKVLILDADDNCIKTADAPTVGSAPPASPSSFTLNVKDYGAVGDGITDDTTAFNDAVAAVIASTDTRTLYLPRGK